MVHSSKQDLRFQKAEQKIGDAFITLIEEKGFNKLTVSDITNRAKINRSTFYAHYVDKYNLLNKLELKILNNVYSIMENIDFNFNKNAIDQLFEGFREIANYLYAERKVINVLYNHGDGKFMGSLKQSIKEELHKVREKSKIEFNDYLPSDYADELIVDSALNIILFWIQKEKPETPEQFAKILTSYRQLVPIQLLKKE